MPRRRGINNPNRRRPVYANPSLALLAGDFAQGKDSAMHLCLFEDRAEQFEPLSLTRPVFDLCCGMATLAQKIVRHLAPPVWGVLLRPLLEDIYRLQHPHVAVNDADWLRADPLVLANGRWLPPNDAFVMP